MRISITLIHVNYILMVKEKVFLFFTSVFHSHNVYLVNEVYWMSLLFLQPLCILKIILLHVHIQKDKWWLSKPRFISSLWILDDPVDDQRLHASVAFNAQQAQSKYLFWTLVFYFHLICMYYHLSTKQNLLYVITLSSTSISISTITLLFKFEKTNGDYWDHLLSHPYEFQMT